MSEQRMREIIRGETKRLEKKIEQLESELQLTKQHMSQAVQLISDKFSSELGRLLDDYKESLEAEALAIIQDNK
ncbi:MULTISPECIES: hypothetical protein [Paenibacillus]|uniref:Uncharacterized protein n=1 Tax=Paenibacillus lautus TaxID=1401 RepID=A0A1R1ALX3_PAELA|nr:hypothetical protein [Paenibacillus lautus]OME86536.1 hypothetical protein BK123_32560 [Paenibacillus lautus]